MIVQTEFQTFLDSLGKALEQLSPACQLAFAVACCERHFDDYSVFYREQHWGNPEILREAIDTAWAVIMGTNPGQPATDLLARCMSAIPHSDQFSTPSADYAQNAAIMVAHVVEFMLKSDVKYVVMTASLARDLVDARVQIAEDMDASDPHLEQKIAEHPLMQAELECQKRWLTMLRQIKDGDGLNAFRKTVRDGIS